MGKSFCTLLMSLTSNLVLFFNYSGFLRIDQFLGALNLPLTPITQDVFQLFDSSDKGYINFREVSLIPTKVPVPQCMHGSEALEAISHCVIIRM